jgi:DDE superfamily endonuclease
MMRVSLISTSYLENTIWQMQASHPASELSYHFEGDATTLPNGAVQDFGTSRHCPSRFRAYHQYDSPANAEELFNLRHSSARNIIERIFGIVKNRFAILTIAPHYDMDVQARLAPALAAIHNFIRLYDPDEILDLLAEAEDTQPGARIPQTGDLALGPARAAERMLADGKRDGIAQSMWVQYQMELANRDGQ